MSPDQLRAYLHAHIPITRAMQVDVLGIDAESVVLGAPLSLSSVGSSLRLGLEDRGRPSTGSG